MPAPSDAAAAAVHVANRPDAPGEPPSTTTSSSDLTVLEADRSSTRSRTLTLEAPHDDATPAPSKGDTGPVKTTGLFREPGTMPLPDHGERALGVVFEGVTVYGAGGTRRTVEGLEKAVFKMWDLPGFLGKLFNVKLGKKRPLVSDCYGVLPAGETMLVLGRPGSGCSTLLRVIANQRSSFAGVDGDVQYGRLSAKEAEKAYSGEIVFNSEDDIHRPLLTVAATLGSALALKKPHAEPSKRRAFAEDHTSRLLDTFGMPHVAETFVGNEYIRGVSGGERKRVSLAEHFSTNAAISCFDNCVRGLDSAVALHFIKVLRELSLSTGMSNIVSIYQASQEMYRLFDRVAVLYEGQLVFMGRAEDGQRFFEAQGWYKNPRQTTPDFLTSCTSPTERTVREDHQGVVPQTPDEMARYFRASPYWLKLQDDIAAYKALVASSDSTDRFVAAVAKAKMPLTGKNNGYKVNFALQVWELMRVQFRLQAADPTDIVVRLAANAFNALIVGSVSYKPPASQLGAFAVAGALFFAILYFVIFSFSEIPTTVLGRPLLIKHRGLGFYTPAANTLALMIADIPLYTLQTLVFSALFYFLIGLNPGAKYFFTFFFIAFTNYAAMSVCYRMIASWSPNLSVAVRYGGFALSLVLSCAGFVIPPREMLGWMSWMRRIAPPAYALEALLANEFRTRTLQCTAADLVPNGPGYDNIAYQACPITGSQPGSATVSGATYIDQVYGFSAANIWRNVGIMWAMYAIYAALVIVGSSLLIRDTGSASAKVFKRGGRVPEKHELTKVESKRQHLQAERVLSREVGQEHQDEKTLEGKDLSNAPVFTFEDVRYTVQVGGGDKVLLDGVTALVQPGRLTALMGASGAGKTTLLDTVSQRKTSGKVEGQFLIDGKPLAADFGRRAGFCQQNDIHEPLSTVRECLQFSALLRQPASKSREEKLAFAEQVIELLELQEIADAIIGNPEIGGLGVEERKRVTIGVELAADPDFLLFLDEPTSGLDSNAAFEVCRFLRKIASSGIAVLCTIHQPSGELFELFDDVVLLAPGGKTVYAGPTGERASDVASYFARLGAPMPPDANPAEHILATVAPVGGAKVDWAQHWRSSAEAQHMSSRIAAVKARSTVAASATTMGSDQPSKFAAGFGAQLRELVRRNFRAQWRDGSYHLTKLASCVFFGLLVGFFYYHFDPSVVGIQSMSLALLVLTQVAPPLALDIAANYLAKMNLFLSRERNGIYDWTALVASLLIVELPVLLVAFLLLFFCYFWTVGFDSIASVGGLAFLQWLVFAVFLDTFGVFLGAVSPSPMAVPYVLSALWILFNITSWTLVPHNLMSAPYRWFAGYLSPMRWFLGSLVSNHLGPLAVTCKESEWATFLLPDGESCRSYADAFLTTAAGYVENLDATGSCRYCPMSTGRDYLASLGYAWDHRYRDWGVFVCFAVVTGFSCFAATYLIRIRPLYR
ncbi:putative ABC transporter PMR5 [Rhodotorula diobovata]|uniref:Putative ABC transporter PMR5 n=1 Tax=Rhodotorula diobovata TaxID=5288 RepID=A0A5C5FWW7_9BASI|nr:putative ABC transporter PMR5 [Rhodotorula diobovata]